MLGTLRTMEEDTDNPSEAFAAIGGTVKLAGLFVIAAGSVISIWLIGSLLLDWVGEVF